LNPCGKKTKEPIKMLINKFIRFVDFADDVIREGRMPLYSGKKYLHGSPFTFFPFLKKYPAENYRDTAITPGIIKSVGGRILLKELRILRRFRQFYSTNKIYHLNLFTEPAYADVPNLE
jgi:hypothetical protein